MISTQLGLLFGLDNAAVALALGPLRLPARRMVLLGLLFGASETSMTLLGNTLGQFATPAAQFGEPMRVAALATLGVAVLGLAAVRLDPAKLVGNAWALGALALLLGLDNLLAGAALSAGGASFAAVTLVGIVSAALAFGACAVGGISARFAPTRWGGFASGGMLLAIAAAELT